MPMVDLRKTIHRKTSFLKPLWWLIHLTGISVVYTLGHILWK